MNPLNELAMQCTFAPVKDTDYYMITAKYEDE